MAIYAKINKDTLLFIRLQKQISFNYIERIAKFDEEKMSCWEDLTSKKFPTINQAKTLARCYHVPFAGFYMNSSDINIKRLPVMRNLRTLQWADVDNTALNLAILDLMDYRELLVVSKKERGEEIPSFDLSFYGNNPIAWARYIRKKIGLSKEDQFKCKSARKLYLLIRERVENCGIFIHCFTGLPVEEVRGIAVYDNDDMPIIGINENDRYPAKSFSIIHELVHAIKKAINFCKVDILLLHRSRRQEGADSVERTRALHC